jgi:hypothetical protein
MVKPVRKQRSTTSTLSHIMLPDDINNYKFNYHKLQATFKGDNIPSNT